MTFAELVQWHADQHPELCDTEESTAAYRKAVAESLKGLGYGEQIETPADMSQWQPLRQVVSQEFQLGPMTLHTYTVKDGIQPMKQNLEVQQ